MRVTDILSELTRQLGPLEKQAEKARIYLQKKEELKTLDINLFLLEAEHSEKQRTETEQKKAAAEEELSEATEAFERTKQEYEEIEKHLEELEETIQAAREKALGPDAAEAADGGPGERPAGADPRVAAEQRALQRPSGGYPEGYGAQTGRPSGI